MHGYFNIYIYIALLIRQLRWKIYNDVVGRKTKESQYELTHAIVHAFIEFDAH